MIQLEYFEWSDSLGQAEQRLLTVSVTRQELFLRKLVNATVIRNRMFEHTSNESDDIREHAIYAKPYRDYEVDVFGPAIWKHAFEFCDVSDKVEAVFCKWNGIDFAAESVMFEIADEMDIAELLLDHYLIDRGRTYEVIYTLLDQERNKVLFFLKEVVG